MKLALSYFYQIRFFTPNMVPFSTAMWDPKWFQKGKDRRGVYTGIRIEPLVPGEECSGLCSGASSCRQQPGNCQFLSNYRAQLHALNCGAVIDYLEKVTSAVRTAEGFAEEPIAVIMVYEAPSNACSERGSLLEWFRENGYQIEEWQR